jgi:hypothetical protein
MHAGNLLENPPGAGALDGRIAKDEIFVHPKEGQACDFFNNLD